MLDDGEESVIPLCTHIARLFENAQLQLIAYVFVLDCQHIVEIDVLFLFDQFVSEYESFQIYH